MAIDTTAERLSVIGHMADMPVLPVGSAIDTTAERLALLQLFAGAVEVGVGITNPRLQGILPDTRLHGIVTDTRLHGIVRDY